jgi:hypothetical protein
MDDGRFQGRFQDPILELNRRRGGSVGDIISLAAEMTPAEAEIELSNLDRAEDRERWAAAREQSAGILADWRRRGLV